jgi:hypothetical protein
MRDEDDNWLDALGGRANGPAEATTDTEGQSLRAAILARNAADETRVAAQDPDREAALIARASTAGVLPSGPVERAVTRGRALTRGAERRARWNTGWPVQLAAASIACVVIALALQMRTHPPAPVMRGAVSEIVRIKSPDPARLKEDLIRELAGVGVQATGYQSFGREGLDADLPAPLPADVRGVLQRHGIDPPRDNVLQVEIELASPP